MEALARAGLRNPIRVAVAVTLAPGVQAAKGPGGGGSLAKVAATGDVIQVTPSSLSISYLLLESTEKLAHLLAFLKVRCFSGWSQAGARSKPCLHFIFTQSFKS